VNEKTGSQWTNEQHLLHTFLDHSPDYVFFKDRQSRFVVTNDAHAQLLLGLDSAHDAVGKSDFDFFDQEEAQRFFDEEQRIMETGQPVIARDWSLTSSTTGETVWLSEHKLPIRDKAGQIVGLLGISRDISLLKQSEAERERLLAILEHRNAQLQAAADVSTVASSILDPRELVQKVVDLIRERFDLYYVGLFLAGEALAISDEPGMWAYLQAGTGEAGRHMVGQRHRLKVGGNSMIGQCIASGKARITQDVEGETVRFSSPLLPDTRSELALPLVTRGEVIGALSVQSSEADAFSGQDITVLQTVANQLANAIENARLFKQTEDALEEVKAMQRRYIRAGWEEYLKR
jgi:PAS domain S-box-containing protein